MPKVIVDIEMSFKFKGKFKLIYHGSFHPKMHIKN